MDLGEIKVEDCPTEVTMWAGILTKPLQGKGFRVQRTELVTCAEDYSEAEEASAERKISWEDPVSRSDGPKVGKPAGMPVPKVERLIRPTKRQAAGRRHRKVGFSRSPRMEDYWAGQ